MASTILHIKDSYYFEVPKKLWSVRYGDKSEFPDIWVRLDDQYQLWEAGLLYDEYQDLKPPGIPSKQELISEYVDWKHDHANAGKPFDRYLEEVHDPEFFAKPEITDTWRSRKESTGGVDAFVKNPEYKWSPEKIHGYNNHLSGKILIPQPFGTLRNLYQKETGVCVSKFMIIQVVVALLLWAAFSWLGRRVTEEHKPTGRLWNLLEVFVLFIRDQVARPAIGHGADKFVPLLLTLFFFVLGCNLFGMLPWAGAPTGEWGVTFGLALVTFGTVIVFGMKKFGVVGFFLNQIPSMDLPLPIAIVIKPVILAIELLGLVIKHAVLSVRLLANMVAGHIVLLSIMTLAFSVEGVASFMKDTGEMNLGMWTVTAVIAVVGSTLFSCLELFVAFLQAYVFTFLSALFIGAATHHH